MRVVVTIQHPAHVHFFRHAIAELEARGHEVHVFAREKEMAVELLEAYEIDHEVLAGKSTSMASLAAVQATYETRLLRRAIRIRPDAMVAIGGVAVSHVAPLVGARSVVFYDTEHAAIIRALGFPFADLIYTPECYTDDYGPGHRRYRGFHELAYLAPDRFEPDPAVLDDLDLAPDDTFAVVRCVEWGASHDVGHGGFSDLREVIERLTDAGARVLVTAEGDLPADLEGHRAAVAPERVHDLLAFADLFVGEGATMAAESAVLGTPACYVNSLSMGYTTHLEEEYGLLRNFHGPNRHARALDRAVEMLGERPEKWADRRARLLADTEDTTSVVVDAVESTTERRALRAVA